MMEQREKRNKKEGTMVRKLTADGVDANFPLASIRVVDINPPDSDGWRPHVLEGVRGVRPGLSQS